MTMGYYSYGLGQEDYFPGDPDVSCAPGTTAVLTNGVWTCKAAPISCAKGTPVLVNGVWGCSSDASAGGGGANWGSCAYQGTTGKCQTKSKACSGSYRAGLCPGPADVQCCLPKTTQPSTPSPAAPAGTEYGPFEKPQAAGTGGGILGLVAAGLLLFALSGTKSKASSGGRKTSSGGRKSSSRRRRNPDPYVRKEVRITRVRGMWGYYDPRIKARVNFALRSNAVRDAYENCYEAR